MNLDKYPLITDDDFNHPVYPNQTRLKVISKNTQGEQIMCQHEESKKKKKTKYYQCGKCGRFVKIIAAGAYMDDFGYWVTYECKVHGVQHD